MMGVSVFYLEKSDARIPLTRVREVPDTDTHSIKVGGILLNELRKALFRLL